MSCRSVAVFLVLLLSTSLGIPLLGQFRPDQSSGRGITFANEALSSPFGDTMGVGRISGTVRTLDGHPVADANVEVRDVERGSRSVSGRTDSQGSFSISNVAPGSYEVTVSMGVDEAHERVQVTSVGDSTVNLRLPRKDAGEPGGKGSTVSFSQVSIPPKARSLYEKASELLLHNKAEEARKKVDAALALYPKFAEALTLRGILQDSTGRRKEAIEDMQQAISFDPNYAVAYLALASLFNSSGRFQDAAPVLGQVERLAPNSWQTYFELARTNIGIGEFAKAIRNIDHVSVLQGKDRPEFHLVRGYAFLGLTEMPNAAHELEAFLASKPVGTVAEHARHVLDELRANTITASR